MTSSDTPRSAADPAAAVVVRIRDPGELIAAVPVLLGFHPRESLVLIATGGRSGRRLGLTLRVDLPPPEHAEVVCRQAAESLLLDDPAGAVVIVLAAPSGADPPRGELVDMVVRRLEGQRIDVQAALWAASTSAAARWACYEPCTCTGVLPDPSATAFAAAAVLDGHVVRADREELERSVAPADPERLRRREQRLISWVDEEPPDLAIGPDGQEGGLQIVDAAIADAVAGRLVLDDIRVVAIATALTLPAVRDAALLRCAGPMAGAVEQLWAGLVRETPDPEAAEPAALLAVSALLRGDGALANVALARAEGAWPGHRLTAILRSLVEAGIRPTQLRARLGQGISGSGAVLDVQRARSRSERGRR